MWKRLLYRGSKKRREEAEARRATWTNNLTGTTCYGPWNRFWPEDDPFDVDSDAEENLSSLMPPPPRNGKMEERERERGHASFAPPLKWRVSVFDDIRWITRSVDSIKIILEYIFNLEIWRSDYRYWYHKFWIILYYIVSSNKISNMYIILEKDKWLIIL